RLQPRDMRQFDLRHVVLLLVLFKKAEVGTHVKEFALDGGERGGQPFAQPCCQRHTDLRVQLVHRAIDLYAQRVFVDTLSAAERGLAAVALFCVDFYCPCHCYSFRISANTSSGVSQPVSGKRRAICGAKKGDVPNTVAGAPWAMISPWLISTTRSA